MLVYGDRRPIDDGSLSGANLRPSSFLLTIARRILIIREKLCDGLLLFRLRIRAFFGRIFRPDPE